MPAFRVLIDPYWCGSCHLNFAACSFSSFFAQVTTLHFVNEETLAAVGGDDKNAFFVWDLGTGQSLFQGSAGGTPVYLLRGIYGWADSGGREGESCSASGRRMHLSCNASLPILP
jgi:hypothetical protein